MQGISNLFTAQHSVEDTRCIDEIDELKKIFYTFFVLTESISMTEKRSNVNTNKGILKSMSRSRR